MTNNSITKALSALSFFNKQSDIAASAIDKTISAVANATHSVVQNVSVQTTTNQVINLNTNFSVDVVNQLFTQQNIVASKLNEISTTISTEFKLVIEELSITFEAFKLSIENLRFTLNKFSLGFKASIGSFADSLIAFSANLQSVLFNAFSIIGGSSIKLKIPLPLPVRIVKDGAPTDDPGGGGSKIPFWLKPLYKTVFARKKLKTKPDDLLNDTKSLKFTQGIVVRIFSALSKFKYLTGVIKVVGWIGRAIAFVGSKALYAVPGLNIIVGIIDAVLLVIGVFKFLWKQIDSFRGFVAVIVDIGRQIFEHIANAFAYVGDLIMGFVQKWIIDPIMWVWDVIKNFLNGLFSWLTDLIIKIASWIPGIDTDRLERVRIEAENDKDMTPGDLFGKKKDKGKPIAVLPEKFAEIDVSSGFAVTGASFSANNMNMKGFVGTTGGADGIGLGNGKSITIDTLVEEININVTNLRESTSEIKETLKKVLLEALKDTQLADQIN